MNDRKKAIEKAVDDLVTQMDADDMFTKALELLEVHQYIAAHKMITNALKVSNNIEQRFALQMLLILSEKKDDKLTKTSLSISYNIK